REQKQLAQKLEEEAKALEEEKKRKEEERQKKEKKDVSLGKQPAKPDKGKTKPPENKETKAPEKKTKPPKKKETKPPDRKETKIPGKKETKILEIETTKIPEKKRTKIIEEFQIYESSQQNVAQVFSYWDRVQGTVWLPVIQKRKKSQPSAENQGQKTSKPQEKVEKKPAQKRGGRSSLQSSQLETQSEVAEGAVRDKNVGVPCLDIQVTDPKAMFMEILSSGRLPTEDQVLRHLGLHPEGPPLPPAAVLSIAQSPDVKSSSAEGQPKMDEVASRDNFPKENQISTQRTESPQDSSTTRPKSALKSASTPTEFLR
ncbi:HYDIN protein, partial [Acrocephalus arundinaceus]|nr:HYDIN protein [Acrocephalus arundinaceus]